MSSPVDGARFDIDVDALSVCQANLEKLLEEGSSVDLVQTDVRQLLVQGCRWHGHFDTVLLNPPFGTKNNQGTDMLFLEVLCYSLWPDFIWVASGILMKRGSLVVSLDIEDINYSLT